MKIEEIVSNEDTSTIMIDIYIELLSFILFIYLLYISSIHSVCILFVNYIKYTLNISTNTINLLAFCLYFYSTSLYIPIISFPLHPYYLVVSLLYLFLCVPVIPFPYPYYPFVFLLFTIIPLHPFVLLSSPYISNIHIWSN